ncbi:MAG: ATP-binding protein [Anaerolineae bacterium]|nr:ATP-binding protein [Anaerolineae bacterium]
MTPTNVSLTTLWRNKIPGLPEFTGLINQLSQPAVILDRSRNLIMLGNSALLKLTAFTQDELISFPSEHLFSDVKIYQLMPGEERQVQVNRRNRTAVLSVAQGSYLDPDNQWMLVTLTPIKQLQQNVLQRQERVFQGLLDLAGLSGKANSAQAFEQALIIARSLLDTELICIYQADGMYPQLKKIASLEPVTLFPDTLPSTDLIRLSQPFIWTPGKRVLTEIHRAGRVENLAYVATAPLGQSGALFGLLVAGDRENLIDDQQIRLMDVLSTHISSAFHHYILINNLKAEMNARDRSLSVRNEVLESSGEGILLVELDFTILQINPSAEEMLGYADHEVRGQQVENILIGPDNLMPILQDASKGIATPDMGSVYVHKRNGHSFPAHIKILPVERDGHVIAIMIFVMDVSDFEQIRIRTQQLEHRAILGELMAVFAHEVRNPINNIFTGLQLLGTRFPEDAQIQDLINRMTQDYYRLNHLMESVLNYARASDTKNEDINLDLFIQRILDRWRPKFTKARVEAKYFKASENIPKIWGDPRTLEQVFTNLISNAVEAMSRTGGSLTVRLAYLESYAGSPHVEVDISDNGPGIPDELREHIFEPFVTNKSTGTGLGLAIVKNIVTSHKGTIEVKSFPGGTLFQVYLPANQGE